MLGLPYFDTNAYFWEATDPPFTERRPPARRDARLAHDLAGHQSWLIGGSIGHWGEPWLAAFDLVVIFVAAAAAAVAAPAPA